MIRTTLVTNNVKEFARPGLITEDRVNSLQKEL
ncbi:type II toxin-antitoxin system VapC family toxin [Salmonella enterica subsp. diarizonae]|nr:type II toxin-antitoxin system VapC family toxin [Salmonella enterica subsp. diarizonae]EGV2901675.1 type II toxin-antitoxin system VapC family toxin [Salmonella enterica]